MAEGKTTALPKREDIPVEETWDLEAIYPSVAAWEQAFEKVKELIAEAEQFKGKIGESADSLYALLKKQDEVTELLYKVYVYAHMKNDENTANATFQALHDRASSLAAVAGSKLAFIVPEILAIDPKRLNQFVEGSTSLQLYRHALDEIIRTRPHVLDSEKEALLAAVEEVTDASSTTFGMLNNADLKFPTIKGEAGQDVEITHGRYGTLMESENRQVRKDTFEGVYKTYGAFKNTLASTLSGQIKRDSFYANARKYTSAREAALFRNDIPEAVYDNLIKTIHEHLPLMYRYVALRKKALQVDELHMYDLYAPLVPNAKIKVTYDEAKEIVLKALAPLGEDYLDSIRDGFKKRWIDVRETQNKRSGGYSGGSYGTMPYILLNWQDNIDSMFTLAHELGHSMHSYYSRTSQPYPYSDYSIFVAEVASTCNEALLNHYLLNHTDDKKRKLYLLNNQLEGFKGTVFRQTMFAEFEHIIHEKVRAGEALTADLLTETYYSLNKTYFGPDIVVDPQIGLEWARIPHFYYNYYVYQYATGFSAASALSAQILQEGTAAVERYKNYLKSGSSESPIEILKKAGVNMAEPKPVQQAMDVFANVLDETERLLFS
ncbi:oligoendopeptidase F [Sporolactobacillus inulinus]|uniref:Oligopeptidase F n=2 Tax=Sporolactobacillus inulinus TaxID=2078 RepID=A0A4Y1ZAD5_9BACL|nr:oligoendopeptidase F [Sporolactobacillus inulinus]KLI03004.1 oligopeptidase PepB [Sporolactobacillus inulinus CASD]GAY75873.1 oligoendopeptidase F [Sporolactobacillus inulinus]GEB76549.1 oligoendopeptidase F [Sporolactobacillus inulinus]